MNNFYDQFLSSDLNLHSDCIRILQNEKHTRVEGFFTEFRFCDEILKDFFKEYSTGWWITKNRHEYDIFKLTHNISDLTSLEFDIMDWFTNSGVTTFLVEYCRDEFTFFYAQYSTSDRDLQNEKWSTIKSELYPSKSIVNIASVEYRDQIRIDKVIEFLSPRREIRKYAIERIFANCYLGSGAVWDIDYIVRFGRELIAFEVKHKYPTRQNQYGINLGEAIMLDFLHKKGMDSYYIILQKPSIENIKNISPVDIFENDELRRKCNWIGTKFDPSFLVGEIARAPQSTSIDGTSRVNYHKIDPDLFTLIKEPECENNILHFLNRFP